MAKSARFTHSGACAVSCAIVASNFPQPSLSAMGNGPPNRDNAQPLPESLLLPQGREPGELASQEEEEGPGVHQSPGRRRPGADSVHSGGERGGQAGESVVGPAKGTPTTRHRAAGRCPAPRRAREHARPTRPQVAHRTGDRVTQPAPWLLRKATVAHRTAGGRSADSGTPGDEICLRLWLVRGGGAALLSSRPRREASHQEPNPETSSLDERRGQLAARESRSITRVSITRVGGRTRRPWRHGGTRPSQHE
jgi:hypothetical protein